MILGGVPHWVCAEVTVHATLEKFTDHGEYWGSAYSVDSYEPKIESAEILSIGVWAASGNNEYENQTYDETLTKLASVEAVRSAMKLAEEDTFDE
jgi:hypothetical protein